MGSSALNGGRRSRLRAGGWSATRRRRFLTALEQSLNVSESARTVSTTAKSAYDLKRRDPEFATAWREALDKGYCELELSLLRQAVHGSQRTETVIDGKAGEIRQIKTVHSYPQAMAMRLLLAHRAEVEAFRKAPGNVAQPVPDVIALVRSEMLALRERFGGATLDEQGFLDDTERQAE
jgi:hypothetical protein